MDFTRRQNKGQHLGIHILGKNVWIECYVPTRKGLHLFGLLTAKKVIVRSGNEQHLIVSFFQETVRDVVWILVGVLEEIGEAVDPTPELSLLSGPDHEIYGVL